MPDEQRPTEQPDTTERKEQYLARVSHVQMGLVPTNMEEGMRLADLLAKSTLVPEGFRGNPANCFIALQFHMLLLAWKTAAE